jgi:hypothetical protein
MVSLKDTAPHGSVHYRQRLALRPSMTDVDDVSAGVAHYRDGLGFSRRYQPDRRRCKIDSCIAAEHCSL